jgi:hypothetical protein
MSGAGTAEYALGTTTYWTDDQLESVLDRYRTDVYREPLVLRPIYVNGTARYHDYYWRRAEVEQATSGTAAWRLETSAGALIGTANYSVNYEARHIRFSADQGGVTYYLTYRAYDLNRAAAEVWESKAAHVADRFDVETDNHNLLRSQLYNHYMNMAKIYRRRSPAMTSHRTRADVNPLGHLDGT